MVFVQGVPSLVNSFSSQVMDSNIEWAHYCPVPTPDIVLQPPVGDISILDFHKADKLVEIGYEYTITEWQRLIGVADDCTVFI